MKSPAHPSLRIGAVVCCAACAATATAQAARLPDYKPAHQVSGTIRICGSPQMGDLLKLYEQAFVKQQPTVHFEEDLQSTLTAVSGVATGHADIGLLGREIWPTEVQTFASATGHAPTVIDVATGSYEVPQATFALMIFVPVANPIASLSTAQLARIFASADHPIRTWGELGLTGGWAARPIHLYGFTVDNDKSQIFRQLIFTAGERWNPALHQFANAPGAPATDAGELILQSVAGDPDAIGISNIHYATPAVKPLALSKPAHPALIPPTRANVANRTYPLTRAVYMVTNGDAAHPPTPAVLEFLRYVLSRQGAQAIIREGNYLPLPAEVAVSELHKLPAP
ncbi:MAG TPA: substrate-binding domain-containing protein [Acidobacteriaceae bacterium]